MIIGISGFSGSDKLKYAQKISFDYGAPIISLSSFGKSNSLEPYSNWGIIDYDRVIEEIIKPYKTGFKMLTYGVFSWKQNKIINKTSLTFKDSIIIEGSGLFRSELLPYIDKKIWVDSDIDQALLNYSQNYKEEYKHTIEDKTLELIKKNDLEYFNSCKPYDIADEIIKD